MEMIDMTDSADGATFGEVPRPSILIHCSSSFGIWADVVFDVVDFISSS